MWAWIHHREEQQQKEVENNIKNDNKQKASTEARYRQLDSFGFKCSEKNFQSWQKTETRKQFQFISFGSF